MNIWLKPLELEDGDEFFEILSTLSKYDDFKARPVPDFFKKEDYETFKRATLRMANNDNLPSCIIPTNTYWIMHEEAPIGYATLRHYLHELSSDGYIKYSLLKQYQNQGLENIIENMLETIAIEELGIDNFSQNKNYNEQNRSKK